MSIVSFILKLLNKKGRKKINSLEYLCTWRNFFS